MPRSKAGEAEARAGFHPPPSCVLNMSLRSKTLAGIVALISSVLLGSCGTHGEGEEICALSGQRGFFVRGELCNPDVLRLL